MSPGRIAQSVGHLTGNSEVLGLIPGLATFVSPSTDSRGAFVSYWRKYVHKVLVNRLGGLSLPRKSVVRLTDRPDMTLDVYHGPKTTTQQQQHFSLSVQMYRKLRYSLVLALLALLALASALTKCFKFNVNAFVCDGMGLWQGELSCTWTGLVWN